MISNLPVAQKKSLSVLIINGFESLLYNLYHKQIKVFPKCLIAFISRLKLK